MNKASLEPKTLMEAIRHFSNPDVCINFVASLRWPNGPVCPKCGGTEHGFVKTRRLWNCRNCNKRFSVKMGTIFEDSPLGLDKWLCAIWLEANCKNGVSSYEVHRSLGVTQKTAWFMLHRIRLAMQSGSIEKMDGEVEADETFIGGLAKNMHRHRRAKSITGTGGAGKAAVLGILQRSRGESPSRIRAKVVPNVQRPLLHAGIKECVEPGSVLYTDRWRAYRGLSGYTHRMIDHTVEYVNGRVHTNGIENFWSLLKRSLHGTYVSVRPRHLFRYVDEQAFRFNHRCGTDADRFAAAVSGVSGRRLTYAALTAPRR